MPVLAVGPKDSAISIPSCSPNAWTVSLAYLARKSQGAVCGTYYFPSVEEDRLVVVQKTRVLVEHAEGFPKDGPSSPILRMTMRSRVDFWSSFMYRRMDRKSRLLRGQGDSFNRWSDSR